MTVNWLPTNNDDYIKKELKNTALRYGVETNVDVNFSHWIRNYTRYAVEISGLNIPWNGGHNKCKHIMKILSKKWIEILNENNVNDFKINIDHLPM